MRLICPNCGAQYEVPDEVIPKSGRDVQCSNCGDTWFQHHPDHPPDFDKDTADQQDWDDVDSNVTDDQDDAVTEARLGRAEAEPAPKRGLDPSIADVLREEASREERARAADKIGGLETQPDLGVDQAESDADIRTRQARDRMARLQGKTEPQPQEELGPGSRKNLLPDVDEINSSITNDKDPGNLSAADAAGDKKAKPSPAGRSGFRRGFRIAIMLALLATVLYLFAPQLASMVPALQEPLTAYVESVNQARAVANQQIAGLVELVKGLISGQ